MNLIEIFSIIIIHWFADFVLQTDKQAKDKSKNWSDLLEHTLSYSTIWFIVGNLLWILYDDIWIGAKFALITFIAHTITDYFTSRLNSKLIPKREYAHNYGNVIDKYSFFRYKTENWHNFFVSVGFDQVLHYIQLFLTYYYLKTWA